jgi:glycine betaine/proline transport system substrate-binding protein
MDTRTFGRRVAMPMLLAAFGSLTGCSSSSTPAPAPNTGGATGDGGAQPQSGVVTTINLAHNDWLSANLNDQIAQIILQEHMGITVNFVPATTAGQWDSIRSGALDITLEVWPSGHPDEMAKLNAGDPALENGGLLGPIAKAGWFIPTYLLTPHPELATWEGFKDPSNAALFQSATSGGKGRFLGGDPTWVQYDQKIIDNLGLNFVVEFAGSEDAEIAELDNQYNKRGPLLFYLWTPEWVLAKYDLTMVTLPTNTDACWAQASSAQGPNCDYPADHLFKLMRSGLKNDAPLAYQFFKNMNYTTKDQISMMAAVKLQNLTVDQAARQWLAANTATWQSWIPAGAAKN